MTAQRNEKLIFNGQLFKLATEPLKSFVENSKINFIANSSDCWRGYEATWEIKDNKLFLIAFSGNIENYKNVDLEYLFPGKTEVFAEWFSGSIRVLEGKLTKYIHAGYASKYEKEFNLIFDKGILYII